MYRSFCKASKNNFPHAYLVEHFGCTFYSVVLTVFFIGLPWDSTQTIKGLVKVLCLILSCIAKVLLFPPFPPFGGFGHTMEVVHHADHGAMFPPLHHMFCCLVLLDFDF